MSRPARSITVQGAMLRMYRQKINWTQDDLAKASGYSSRLIRKLEKGGACEAETLSNIVEALSVNGQQVSVNELTVDMVAIATMWMDAYNSHGPKLVDKIGCYLTEDFEFYCPGDVSVVPFAGTWRGSDGLRAFFEIYFTLFERIPHDDVRYTYGDNIVIARYTERAFAGGILLNPLRINMCFEFRDGLISRITDDYDAAAGNIALNQRGSEEARQFEVANLFMRQYDANSPGLATVMVPYLANDFELRCDAPRKHFAFGGNWTGARGLAEFSRQYFEVFVRTPNVITYELFRSNQRVMVRFIEQVTVQGKDMPPCWMQIHFRFQDGLLAEVEFDLERYLNRILAILDDH